MRRDFVANVSHELRTPITIIQGYNEALSDGTITDPEDVKKYRKLINDETQRLERLINELLDISRLQRGEGEEMEPIPLGKVVESVVNMLEGRAKNGTSGWNSMWMTACWSMATGTGCTSW